MALYVNGNLIPERLPDNVEHRYGSGNDVRITWETADVDAHYLNIALTGVSRNIIISEDRNIDWGHAAQTNPTLWIHSSDSTDIADWVAIAHNQTDALFTVGNGSFDFDSLLQWSAGQAITATDYQIGRNADGTNLMQINVPTGSSFEFSVNDVSQLQLDATFLQLPDDQLLGFGNTLASPDASLGWNTTQTVDALYLGLSDAQNTLVIAEHGDRSFDFAHGAQTNPTVFIHSAAQNTAQWLSFAHDQTNAIVGIGLGDIEFRLPNDRGLLITDATVDASLKEAIIKGQHYTNAEQNVLIMAEQSTVTATIIDYGGGNGLYNSATRLSFYTAADNITVTGTERIRVNSTGVVIIGAGEGGTTIATGNTFRAPDLITGGAGNIAASDLTIGGGLGTGTGDPSQIIFQVSTPAAAGDILQSRSTVFTLDGDTGSTALLVQPVATSGSPTIFTFTGGAHTTLAASTAAPDISFQLNRTVQFATGALTTQSTIEILSPTYAFVGASTLSNAETMRISGPPRAGTNATITTAYGLVIGEGGSSYPVNSTSAVMLAINPPDIANGVGAMTNLIGLQLTSGGAQLGNQIATLDNFIGAHLLGVTLTSDTNLRTVTSATTFFVGGPPVASTNVLITNPARAVSIGGGAVTAGTAQELLVSTGAHTGMTLSTEASGVFFDLSATKQWATGAMVAQREFVISAPTYGFVGASTVTNAFTADINRPPRAGTNATITTAVTLSLGGGGMDVNATTGAHLSIFPLAIRTGYGAMTTLSGLYYTDGGLGVSLGNQTATLTNLNAIRLDAITYTSTTLVRTVTNPATLYIGGAPVASTNVIFSNTGRAIEVAAGTVEMNDHIVFNTGVAVTATDYSIGRDADGTNQLHLNVPTGATFEFSVNDVVEMTLSSSAVNFQSNTITTTGGGSLTGTWSDLGSVTTIDINGGTIDGAIIGGAVAGAGTFTTLNATGGGALTGTWTNLGSVTTIDINGGTIDGVTIGGSVAGAITGTTITANTNFVPDADDGAGLGLSGTAFSDLFLASGAVINFAAGDVTITHASNALTFAGGTVGIGHAAVTYSPLTAGWDNSTMAAATTAARHFETTGNITELAGAAITDIVGAYFNTFTITDGGGAETVGIVATVYIPNAPTVGTTPTNGPYALFVDAGATRLDGTLTASGGGALTGTWTDLGSVTTIDINGGTIDGATIGGAVAGAITGTTITATSFVIGANTLTTAEWANLDGQNQAVATTSSPTFVNLTITSFAANWTNASRTVADLGIITTVDINGGTIDGTTIGGAVAGAITGTTITANTSIVTAANVDVNMSAGGRLYGGGIQANKQDLGINSNLTLDENDSVVNVTTGAVSNNTITLPAASGNEGMIISVYLATDGGMNAVITRAGADVIQNGSADLANTTVTLDDAGDYCLLQCVNSSMWQIVVNNGGIVA